jgi:hypothetical protein
MGRMISDLVALPKILGVRQDLQVVVNVQPAYNLALQRVNVINVVLHSSLFRHCSSGHVDSLNRINVRPLGRGSNSSGYALGYKCVDDSWIRLGPHRVLAVQAIFVGCAIFSRIFVAMNLVALIPILKGGWIALSMSARSRVGAIATGMAKTISRCSTRGKLSERFRVPAHIAAFYSGLIHLLTFAALVLKRWLAKSRPTLLANAVHAKGAARRPFAGHSAPDIERVTVLRLVAIGAGLRRGHWNARRLVSIPISLRVGRALISIPVSVRFARYAVSGPTFLRRHFCLISMWRSMIRRTSSAMEMPSRAASRFKYARCGSVNEIICLVTT